MASQPHAIRKPARGGTPADEPTPPAGFPIVGIGASAGGLEAFTELLQHLPLDTGMGFVLVQHLDPSRPSALVELLAKATALPVREVTNSLRIKPDHIYIIPPNTELSVVRGILKLGPRLPSAGGHRSIDAFFESLAQDQQERAIGVVLSGVATDGTLGLEAIKAEGGITFAQDESARYDSMPRSAAAAGCVDFVLSPEKIAGELTQIARHSSLRRGERPAPDGAKEAGGRMALQRPRRAVREEDAFENILLLLRNRFGVDFSLYKISTIERRITRRMVVNKSETTHAYAQFLRGHSEELGALYSDLLINVTSFFRNPEAFEFLRRKVFPRILPEWREDPVRVWVPGCSSGQEAYSLGMAWLEFFDRIPRAPRLQIFASDLNEALLDQARAGHYAKNLTQGLSREQLRRFFTEENGGYRVGKSLRQTITFARQNILSDPPFSHLDLISCRNLLIYIKEGPQKRLLPMFHYALKPAGCLFLGAAESIGEFTGLFGPLGKKHKVFFRKPGPSPALTSRPTPGPRTAPKASAEPAAPGESDFRTEINVQREADRIALNRYAPTSVLISADLRVLQFRGDTSAYLKLPIGHARFDLLKMAGEGLMLPLRTALQQAKKEDKIVRREKVRVGRSRTVNFEVVPLKNMQKRCYLIFFEEGSAAAPRGELRAEPAPERLTPKQESRRIQELEADLRETRDYLASLQEQQEAEHEELQASNEEVTSANEELQSVNEELETSKEELESANEELTTVNDELSNRNAELSGLSSDLLNLQTATHLAILLLGRDLTIRRFSAQAEKQFKLLASDLGRPIATLRHNLVFPDAQPGGDTAPWMSETASPRTKSPSELEILVAEVIDSVREREAEVQDEAGRWYSLRIRPYLTLDQKVDGAVLVLVDIDALKSTEQAIAAARDYAANIVETVHEPLLVLDEQLRVESANQAFYRKFGVGPARTVGKSIFDLNHRQWDLPRLRNVLEDILPKHTTIENFEVEADFDLLGRCTMVVSARRINDPTWKTQRILIVISTIIEPKQLPPATGDYPVVESVLRALRDPVLLLNPDLRVHAASEKFYTAFKVAPADTVGRLLYDLGNGQWNNARLDELLKDVLPRMSGFDNFEVAHNFEQIGQRTMLLHARPLPALAGQPARIFLGIQDITERLGFQTAMRWSEMRYRRLFEAAQGGILILDWVTQTIVDANPFAAGLLDRRREELLGKELSEIGLLGHEEASRALFRELQEQGSARRDDLLLVTKTGRRRELAMVSHLYEEQDGAVVVCNFCERPAGASGEG